MWSFVDCVVVVGAIVSVVVVVVVAFDSIGMDVTTLVRFKKLLLSDIPIAISFLIVVSREDYKMYKKVKYYS